MDEVVLVVPSSVLEQLGDFLGFVSRTEHYLPELMNVQNQQFLPRSRVEDDPGFKQLIPYVVLQCGNEIYCYTRGNKGTENRLHDLLSIGIGGHVCREDGALNQEAYRAGFERELEEEVAINSPYEERIIGLVHDPRTPVGSVHLGIVHLLELKHPAVHFRDPALTNARFRTVEELRDQRDRLESWSGFVFEHLTGCD